MTSVAVVAHRGKQLDGGLDELRRLLAAHGVDRPAWYEVGKSRMAGKRAKEALKDGADLLFAWGGDGTVQRCIDTLAGSGVDLAILPAGTANLLASNLGIPKDLEAAVVTGLYGARRCIDVGSVNGERFAVMAGAGFDALMAGEAAGRLKRRVGRLAYVWTGAHAARRRPWPARVRIDGKKWFEGDASCVLVANVGTLTGGITAFDEARPDDGRLEVAVVTADGAWQWARVLGRVVAGRAEASPLVERTTATSVDVRFGTKVPYELDGGERPAVKRLEIEVEPAAIRICVPKPVETW
jgi:diacylglycerol kinase (ATP)